jgi:beta-lactamase regulating signal transducer with metallopeptidase domain
MEQLFLQLARMGLYASVLVVIVLVLRLLLKRAPKRLVCLLWALVAFRLVCPAQIEWRASLMPPPEKVVQTVQEMPSLVLPAQNTPTILPEQPENTVPAEPTPAAPELTAVLSRVWLAGVIAMLLWAGLSDLRLRLRLRPSVRMANGVWLCDEIDTPFVLGLFAPRIYLPYGWDDAQNVYILAHERAHIARGDNWWKLLGWLLLSVYWFHPLLWLAYVLFCRDLELACDEHAVRGLDREGRAAYSQALLDCSSPRRTAFTFPVAFGEIGVKPRVKAVLYRKEPAFWLVLTAILALIAAAVFFLTDRPAEEAEAAPKLTFRDVAELPPIYADHVEVLMDAEIRSIMTGPDAEQMLSADRADAFSGHARFDAGGAFRGVTLEWDDLSRSGSYMVFLEQTTLLPEPVPVIGDAFQQTCTVRDVPVDAQRCEWNGGIWLMADFVRHYEGESPIAVHATVGCNPREGQKEDECIHRLYEIVDSFLNPANKLSLDAVASTFAEMDEQMKFLRRASTEQLINLFPRSDGTYTELLITRLAEAAREGYDGVMAQIDESTLTAEQKAQLKTFVDDALNDRTDLQNLDPSGPEYAAADYLTRLAHVTMLYEEDDLRVNTVASLKDKDRASIPMDGVRFTPLIDGDVYPEPLQIQDRMDAVIDRAEFMRQQNLWQRMYRDDFQIGYNVEKTQKAGDFALVTLYRGVSFRYAGNDEESGMGDLMNVTLWRSGGVWLVMDVSAWDMLPGADLAADTEQMRQWLPLSEAERNALGTTVSVGSAVTAECTTVYQPQLARTAFNLRAERGRLKVNVDEAATVRLYDIAKGTTPVQELAVENPGGSVIFRDLDSSALYYIEIELPETTPSRASVTLRISR